MWRALVIAAVATALGGSEDAWNNVGFDEVGKYGLLQASSIVQGLAFGLVFLNSAGAIATFFVLPAASESLRHCGRCSPILARG